MSDSNIKMTVRSGHIEGIWIVELKREGIQGVVIPFVSKVEPNLNGVLNMIRRRLDGEDVGYYSPSPTDEKLDELLRQIVAP